MPLRPDHQADVGGTDIGGYRDHIGHGFRRAIVMVVKFVDLEAIVEERLLGVDQRVGGDQAKVQRLRDGKDFEGRPQFVYPLHGAVEQRIIGRVNRGVNRRAVVGVEVGQARECQHFAGMRVHQDRGRALGLQGVHAGRQHLLHIRLQGQVDGQRQRVGGLGGVAQPGVERLFNPGGADDLGTVDTFRAKGRTAKDVAGEVAIGVKPHVAGAEIQAGVADFMDLLHLFGGKHLAYPQERPAVGKAPLQRLGVHVGENRGQFGGGMGRVHHVAWLGV